MNFTCGGGSSSVFSNALNALRLSMWTSSMMKTLVRACIGRNRVLSMRSLISSIPVRDAASISCTSWCRSARMATQFGQTPHGSAVGPPFPSGPMQFNARAMMRAVVVLPTPRTPVSMNACATRPSANALRSVRTIASWPIRSSKIAGRYLRASTRYAAAAGPCSGKASPNRPGPAGSGSGSGGSSWNKPDMRGAVVVTAAAAAWLRGGRPDSAPGENSLRLLPSGSDRVGEAPVRRRPPAARYRLSRPAWQGCRWRARMAGFAA